MIKTSVVIPVYNTGIYLEECIGSVYNQTQREIEVIAVNDGSTDDSWEVLQHLQEKYPGLIIVTQDNHGQGYARNVGIKMARGEYIYFLDSDDYIMEDTLESCYECASKNKLDIVLFDALEFEDCIEKKVIKPNNCDRHEIIKERMEVFSGIFFLEKYYRKSYNPVPWSMYSSAAFIKDNDIRFLTGVYFEDNEFYCRMMTLAKRVMYIPQMFYQYRCRKDSTTGSGFDLRKARDHIEVINAMAELKTLNREKGWHAIKEISLSMLLYVTKVCYENSLYDKEYSLFAKILDTWNRICGCTIEGTDDLGDIDYVFNICIYFPGEDFKEIKNLIEDKRKRLLVQTLNQLPLNQEKSKIAIYGCGGYTDKVLDFYEAWIGVIKADVIFLDSYQKDSRARNRGYPVWHIEEIRGKELDYILISSPQYEEEMSDMVWQLYGDQFKVILLHGDLRINI